MGGWCYSWCIWLWEWSFSFLSQCWLEVSNRWSVLPASCCHHSFSHKLILNRKSSIRWYPRPDWHDWLWRFVFSEFCLPDALEIELLHGRHTLPCSHNRLVRFLALKYNLARLFGCFTSFRCLICIWTNSKLVCCIEVGNVCYCAVVKESWLICLAFFGQNVD